ncbi:isoprenoid synthase domain-containing protein [Crucibulum laeve]|uniref:Terpene synthase n=1 Tax=Crucibulum laeve TaxID=68775 RepID=A0A5C3LU86_9AGAR|nr:isoprenoid synthase domain-containing protein [Crucibulum laeve]
MSPAMDISVQHFKLPDYLAKWPWSRTLHPNYDELRGESASWIASLHGYLPQKTLDNYNPCLLACLAYPQRKKELVRLGCDLMYFYLVYDESTDVADDEEITRAEDVVRKVLADPLSLSGSKHFIGKVVKRLREQAGDLVDFKASSNCLDHFIANMNAYTKAIGQEAEERKNKHLRGVEDYLLLRRDTGAARPALALLEFGLELPDSVLYHPVVAELTDITIVLLAIGNDMHSYAYEHASGLDGHNIVTAIMHEHKLDLQDALDWLGVYAEARVHRFLELMSHLPSCDSMTDSNLKIYIDGLGYWVRGNDNWSCEIRRYYGSGGLDVLKTKSFTLKSSK